MVGLDVLVSWFEEHLLEVMDDADHAWVLVNSSGRVVTSSDSTWVTGDLIRDLPLSAWLGGESATHPQWTASVCDGLPFLVLVPAA